MREFPPLLFRCRTDTVWVGLTRHRRSVVRLQSRSRSRSGRQPASRWADHMREFPRLLFCSFRLRSRRWLSIHLWRSQDRQFRVDELPIRIETGVHGLSTAPLSWN